MNPNHDGGGGWGVVANTTWLKKKIVIQNINRKKISATFLNLLFGLLSYPLVLCAKKIVFFALACKHEGK